MRESTCIHGGMSSVSSGCVEVARGRLGSDGSA